jgi:hypothetical protein
MAIQTTERQKGEFFIANLFELFALGIIIVLARSPGVHQESDG